MNKAYLGELRRSAEAGLDTTAQPWKKDFYNGYLKALEAVEAGDAQDERRTYQDQGDAFLGQLDALDRLVSDSVLRGSVQTSELRRWLDATREAIAP